MNFLDKIIRFSLNYRLLIISLSIVVIICGLYAAHRTEVDVFPKPEEWPQRRWNVL